MTDMPPPAEPHANPGMPGAHMGGGGQFDFPPDVKIPLLISAIANLVVGGLGTLSSLVAIFAVVGCFTLPFYAAALVLGIFELMAYLKINNNQADESMVGRLKIFAICDICTFLIFNLVSVICGILVLVNHSKITRTG